MGFFDLLGNLSLLKELYEFMEEKGTTDQSKFERQIKKIIRVVYDDFSNALNDSHEYQNSLPPDGDIPLADRVIKSMFENRAFTKADVLPEYDDIPDVIRKSLAKKVLQSLHSSLEYALRDYITWSKQGYGQINAMLSNLTTELIRDSARDNHSPRRSDSRFHYSNEWTKLWGRDDELEKLEAFCLELKPFSWWAITGEGGSGKTRLAYAFAKRMEQQGWTICSPAYHDKETLYLCSESLQNNTLFLLDYSEYDVSSIGEWMQSLQVYRNQGKLIRVLLVQRIGNKVQDLWPYERVKVETALNMTVYEKFLHLKPLGETNLIQIIKSFASHRHGVSDSEAGDIYEHLGRVDEQLQRPLFAMILTDAYLDNPNEVRLWDRGDILDHIYKKEVESIKSSIFRHCRDSRDIEALYHIGLTIQMMATMTDGFNVEKDKSLLPAEFQEFDKLPSYSQDRFLRTPALFGDGKSGPPYCPSLEPDIIGEYFVLKQWEDLRGKEYIRAAWTKHNYMSRFVSRLIQDFPIKTDTWKDALTIITLPSSIKSIEMRAFERCEFLTSITIPDWITCIGVSSFVGCNSLTSVIMLGSITAIGNSAFKGCKSLTSVVIHGSVSYIEESAFDGCDSLANVTIHGSISSIGNFAFRDCKALTEFTLPDSVTTIGKCAFWGCESLSSITIPDSVTSFGEYSFVRCRSLRSVSIPRSIQCYITSFYHGADIQIRAIGDRPYYESE